MKIIIILGIHGAGKGEQMKLLVDGKYVEDYISTGEVAKAVHDPVSRYYRYESLVGPYDQLLSEGKYWPDGVVNKLVRSEIERLKEEGKKIIGMEAYPRTLDQARALIEMAKEIGDVELSFIYLDLSDEIALERLAGRSTYEKRVDDAVNQKRIALYHQVTDPMIAFLRERGLVKDVDDRPPIEEVHRSIVSVLNS